MDGKNESLKACPHCGREMYAKQLVDHEYTCLENPVAAAAARAALVASSVDGAIGSQTAYDRARVAYPGAASAQVLAKRLGDWAAVARWAGLEAHYNRGGISDEALESHIDELRAFAEHAEDDYPLLPGTWKRKTYAVWPSRSVVTSLVYELG